MIKKIVPFVAATMMVTMNSPLSALAKPYKIKEGVSFDLEACRRTLDGDDVVCTGTFLSRNGEQTVDIVGHGGYDPNLVYKYMTTSQGKTHGASEISVGDQVCRRSDSAFSTCHTLSFTLVEGVKYTSSFMFRDVSPTSSKIALLAISFGVWSSQPVKYRNLRIFQMR